MIAKKRLYISLLSSLGIITISWGFIHLSQNLPYHGPKFGGVSQGEQHFRKQACVLILIHEAKFFDPESPPLLALDPQESYLVHARCRKAGYLQLDPALGLGDAGRNIPVGPWLDDRGLKTAAGEQIYLRPKPSVVSGEPFNLRYSFSLAPMPLQEPFDHPQTLWVRALNFPTKDPRLSL